MATWDDVKSFVRGKYTLQNDTGDYFGLVFNEADGRTQFCSIKKINSKSGNIWIQISSPVGVIPAGSLNAALEALDDKMCGGLVKIDDRHFVRHCMPIEDLSANELIDPLEIVSTAADELEKRFVGGDNQ